MHRLRSNALFFFISILAAGASLYAAFMRPGYFTDPELFGGIFLLQLLLVILWRFEERFFPVLLFVFLAAGTEVPFAGVWTTVRWVILACGGVAGMVLYLKSKHCSFGIFHLAALFCCLAALVSGVVSTSPGASIGKAFSLLLLFLFGAGGARLILRNPKFARRLLIGCEVLVYFTAISYGVFKSEFFGNANSLGAVMGIACMPVLLWGSLVGESSRLRTRHKLAFLLALLLCLDSYSRASISAGLVSCSFLCIGFRRYRLLIQGLLIAGIAAMVVMTVRPLDSAQKSNSLVNAFVYKGRPDDGILASRKTPWDETISSIQQSPWFGTGFGTSFLVTPEKQKISPLRSFAGTSREHGNSYLAITEWVGLLGVIPFAGLLCLIIGNIGRSFSILRRGKNNADLFVPLSAILLAGIVGAFFEDWMFAVGSYLCVFFWSFAFVLPDLIALEPMVTLPVQQPLSTAVSWPSEFGVVLPGR